VSVILDTLDISPEAFASGSGWTIKPEGACKGELCVPLGGSDQPFDLRDTAARLGMAVVSDEEIGAWALGPESLGGRALSSARAQELVLPDLDGNQFRLSSLTGQKVVLVSWAAY